MSGKKIHRYLKSKKIGGNATVYNILCGKCKAEVFVYLKLGKGAILRCYLNRILAPEKLSDLQNDDRIKKPGDLPNLHCPSCEELIGVPIKRRDGRLAFRLRQGYFNKKIRKR